MCKLDILDHFSSFHKWGHLLFWVRVYPCRIKLFPAWFDAACHAHVLHHFAVWQNTGQMPGKCEWGYRCGRCIPLYESHLFLLCYQLTLYISLYNTVNASTTLNLIVYSSILSLYNTVNVSSILGLYNTVNTSSILGLYTQLRGKNGGCLVISLSVDPD